ncbi:MULTISPECIES: glycosyltransferase family 4 protein [Pseudanabaena]|uniref:glycosyltransferase family 4 protein n=1 Tax=Pseudanabaena TaxID=1152 RepID=UPI002479389A|nr:MULTISPECIES: glycosyltransferase family 4 protein [Pseudanabaena]MEA5488867.1 glycosyltransferase family 4 protein [Pseudanabaena sp. CCNP1317]WGS72354.1 glycosyltransferase family 4 protein [Pseudanabaena galeata CCNP1313]
MNRVHHCANYLATSGGGVKSYVDGLLTELPEMFAHEIIPSLKNFDQSQYKLLHLHEGEMILDLKDQCPAVYTLHNHHPYCPSGSKYFPQQGVCDRKMSVIGCTWGHLIDGCGSRRPKKIISNFKRAYSALDVLKKLKITVIANSDYVRSQLIANGLPESQVITLRCGIAATSSKHEPLDQDIHAQKRILFAGRIVPEKGLDWLLRTMPLLDQRIHLDIAGEGWAMPQVRKLAEYLNIGDRLTWHGWCQKEKLEELYRQSFAVIFPSVWPEPAGLVTLEAYARFRPVIASNVGGIPEHVQDGKTGILVEPNNSQDLAAAVTDLANNFGKSREIGIAGNNLFHSEFTLAIHAQRLQEIYDLAIAKFHKSF